MPHPFLAEISSFPVTMVLSLAIVELKTEPIKRVSHKLSKALFMRGRHGHFCLAKVEVEALTDLTTEVHHLL